MTSSNVVTKAKLARELGYSRARITQLAAQGLPVRSDGLLNRVEALTWINRNASSYGGGWHFRGKGAGGLPRKAKKALDDFSPAFFGGQVALYNQIRLNLLELPELLVQLGVAVPIAGASAEAMDMILGRWILAYGPELIEDDEQSFPDLDLRQLSKVAGLPFRPEWEKERQAILDRLGDLLYPVEPKNTKTKGN